MLASRQLAAGKSQRQSAAAQFAVAFAWWFASSRPL
jgi:hypothetical protein